MKYLFLFIISFSCLADDWRTEDTKREAVYMALHVMDWAQTSQIAKHPEKYSENGTVARLMIGEHPSVAQVNQYMISSAILQYTIVRTLPNEYRSTFQYITIVDSGVSVIGNLRISIDIRF